MKIKSIITIATLSLFNTAFADYPEKPIKLIIPYAKDGTSDLIAQAIIAPLSKELGQKIIIENIAGQGGALGVTEIVTAEPDGYTLGIMTSSTHGTSPAFENNVSYNPIEDFTHIGNIAITPAIIAVNSQFPAKNYKEFLEALQKANKSNSVVYTYATTGQGSMQHLLMANYKSTTKTFASHVPYRGSAPALKDTSDNKVDIMFDNLPSTLKYIQEGKLKPIVISSNERIKQIPDVPTFKEIGMDKMNRMAFYGISAPQGVPEEIVLRISDALKSTLSKPEVKEELEKIGAFSDFKTPEQTKKLISDEFNAYSDIVKTQHLTLQW